MTLVLRFLACTSQFCDEHPDREWRSFTTEVPVSRLPDELTDGSRPPTEEECNYYCPFRPGEDGGSCTATRVEASQEEEALLSFACEGWVYIEC